MERRCSFLSFFDNVLKIFCAQHRLNPLEIIGDFLARKLDVFGSENLESKVKI